MQVLLLKRPTLSSVLGVGTMLVLTACGGGGGPSVPPGAPAPVTAPNPTPSASPVSTQATATGMVVDYAVNAPLAGVQVAIAPFTLGASPSPVATTNAHGLFSFTAAAGTYLLVIGSNNPNDTTTTLHTQITLVAGANPLTAPTPPAEQGVTPMASQLSGSFRLTALAGNQLSCFTGANQGRTGTLAPMVPDEYLTETATATALQINALMGVAGVNSLAPLFDGSGSFAYESGIGGVPEEGGAADGFPSPCSSWTGAAFSYVSGNTPFPYATNPASIWYGANAIPAAAPAGVAIQFWAVDSRPAAGGTSAKLHRT